MDFVLDQGDGVLDDEQTAILAGQDHFDSVFIRRNNRFLASDAKRLEVVRSVSEIRIWCGVTRAAVNSLISSPNLKTIDLFEMVPSGRLSGFDKVHGVEFFVHVRAEWP